MGDKSEVFAVADLVQNGILRIGDGYRAKNSELSTQGVPFARAGNIKSGFQFEDADHFPLDALDKVGEKISKPGDVVFTSKGTVGRFAFVKEDTPTFVYSPQLCYWRSLDASKIHPRFLYYWMHSKEFMRQVNGVKGQTDMADYVSLAEQRRMKISLPPLHRQIQVTELLGSLDDKIQVNTSITETLEQLALAIYRHWFVDFGPFQGKDFIESELGQIPEGWAVYPIGEAVKVLGGGTPKTAEPKYWENGSVNWFTPTDLTSSNSMFITQSTKQITLEGLNNSAAKLFPKNSIMMTSRATIGTIGINRTEATTNQGFIVLVPNDEISLYQLYFWLKTNMASILAISNGSTFLEVNRTSFKKLPIHYPKDAEQYVEQSKDIFDQIDKLLLENQTLAEIRDSLIPRLMSGEVDLGVVTQHI